MAAANASLGELRTWTHHVRFISALVQTCTHYHNSPPWPPLSYFTLQLTFCYSTSLLSSEFSARHYSWVIFLSFDFTATRFPETNNKKIIFDWAKLLLPPPVLVLSVFLIFASTAYSLYMYRLHLITHWKESSINDVTLLGGGCEGRGLWLFFDDAWRRGGRGFRNIVTSQKY